MRKCFAEIVKTDVFSRLVLKLQHWSQLIYKIWRFSKPVFKIWIILRDAAEIPIYSTSNSWLSSIFQGPDPIIRIFLCPIFGSDWIVPFWGKLHQIFGKLLSLGINQIMKKLRKWKTQKEGRNSRKNLMLCEHPPL